MILYKKTKYRGFTLDIKFLSLKNRIQNNVKKAEKIKSFRLSLCYFYEFLNKIL